MAFQRVCETFQIVDLNPFQREAMGYFVKKKVDVFVNLYRLGTAVNKSLGQRIIRNNRLWPSIESKLILRIVNYETTRKSFVLCTRRQIACEMVIV